MSVYTFTLNKGIAHELQTSLTEQLPMFNFEELTDYDCIYNDVRYSATLSGDSIEQVSSVEVYINGISITNNISYLESRNEISITFTDRNYLHGVIFKDCFGFVQMSIVLNYNGNRKIFYTPFFSVLIKKDTTTDSIRKMAEYVYKHHEEFLYAQQTQPFDFATLKNRGRKTWDTQLQILKEIISAYEQSQAFFHSNCKFQILEQHQVVPIEKMRGISAKTLQYLAQNPQHLTPVQHQTGIKYFEQNLLPNKTLTPQHSISFDIYENQVVIGFLKTLISSIQSMDTAIVRLMTKTTKRAYAESDYIESVEFICGSTNKRLQEHREQLQDVSKTIKRLYSIYASSLNVTEVPVTCAPIPTPIFSEIPQYCQIFRLIGKWFKHGIYELEKEKFIYPFLVNNVLYEYYILLRLLNGITSDGFSLIECNAFPYTLHPGAKYKNTPFSNTFTLKKDSIELTLFFQPVIFGSNSKKRNKINLYRNTSISYPSKIDFEKENRDEPYDPEKAYYTPDYIIKVTKNNISQYIILDAKFSTVNTVKAYQMPELMFKYLVSVSPLNTCDKVIALYAICGKSNLPIHLESVYDTPSATSTLIPRIEIATILENNFDNADKYQEIIADIITFV